MPLRVFPFLVLLCLCPILNGQSAARPGYQIYGGYTWLSNSFNGIPGSEHPLNGWDAAVGFPDWHNLRFKIDVYGYRGTNLNAPQNAFFIMGGGQYDVRIRRETLFGEVLMGDGGLPDNWGPNGIPSETASFAVLMGGGFDTPITRHLAFRTAGHYQYSYFSLKGPPPIYLPYRIPGLPTNFGRFTTGLVWNFYSKSKARSSP